MRPADACLQAIDLVKTALEAGWLRDADAVTLADEVSTVVKQVTERLTESGDQPA